ncbi:neutral/alkaline non-lysosomal ceramidase N-terminal domain-containing protein [Gordonia sp. CPCC 205333]
MAATGLSRGTASASPGTSAHTGSGFLVGAGKADMTGAIAGQGMMGYADFSQIASGLLQRCWARAYIIVDVRTGSRVVFVNADIAIIFASHRVGVMAALRAKYGSLYTEENININATHNHNSCGGTSWDYAHHLSALGFQRNSYDAEVAGIVAAIEAAHATVAPGTLHVGHGELYNASVNRSAEAFDLNAGDDKRVFPEKVDPQVTTLVLRQGGNEIGIVTWFATHGTSLTDANYLIAADNKGYASYVAEASSPGTVWSFPQTNAGDMTPNLWTRPLRPGGPTDSHRHNCQIIGDRQYRAGRASIGSTRELSGPVRYAYRYINMADVAIDGTYTPNGRRARTSPAMMGAAAAATSTEDNTKSQLGFLKEGMLNPVAQALGANTIPTPPQWIKDVQAPKLIAFPVGIMPPRPWINQVVPIQIICIGDLVLCGAPAEFTIVAGLRVRRTVSNALGVSLENVLLQGYANAYAGYVTTPEEYVSQQYEGGETLFGRYTLCAYMQEFDRLARSLVSGRHLDLGPRPPNTNNNLINLLPPIPPDTSIVGHRYGDVVNAPATRYAPSSTAVVQFCGAHPNNRIRTGSSYFVVERYTGGRWETAYDDNDWCTELKWERPNGSQTASLITITWRVPAQVLAGRYRIRYFGDQRSASGALTAFTGTSPALMVAS